LHDSEILTKFWIIMLFVDTSVDG